MFIFFTGTIGNILNFDHLQFIYYVNHVIDFSEKSAEKQEKSEIKKI